MNIPLRGGRIPAGAVPIGNAPAQMMPQGKCIKITALDGAVFYTKHKLAFCPGGALVPEAWSISLTREPDKHEQAFFGGFRSEMVNTPLWFQDI